MFSLEKIKKTDTSKVWFFRFKKFDSNTYLITNDVWKFEFLSLDEFDKFVSWDFYWLDKYDDLLKKWFIKGDHYEAKITGSYALKNSFIGLWPVLHMIVTTLRCNHKCRYCHAAVAPMEAKNFDMTKETATKVVDTIFYTNSPSLTIEFQWWESLVNWEVVKHVVEYAKVKAQHLKKNLTFSIVTNLTLMTDEKFDWLFENGVDISTSLDGDELTHNYNRDWYDGNSFERVTYWIKKINKRRTENGLSKIWALLTVTKKNLKNYKKIIDTYIELGLDWIFLRWLNPYWFAAADMENLAYESDDWIEFYKKSLDYIIELNKAWKNFREQITCVYLSKILSPQDPNFMDVRSPSGIAIGWVAYNYDGKVYASDESRMLWRMWIDDFLMTDMKETWEETYREMMNSDLTKISVQSSCLDGLPGYNDHVYKPYIWVDIIHNFKTTWSLYNPVMKDEKVKLQVAILDYIFEKMRDEETRKIFEKWIWIF